MDTKEIRFEYLIGLLEEDFEELFDEYLTDYLHDHINEI